MISELRSGGTRRTCEWLAETGCEGGWDCGVAYRTTVTLLSLLLFCGDCSDGFECWSEDKE
jgi:hypothetical protein